MSLLYSRKYHTHDKMQFKKENYCLDGVTKFAKEKLKPFYTLKLLKKILPEFNI